MLNSLQVKAQDFKVPIQQLMSEEPIKTPTGLQWICLGAKFIEQKAKLADTILYALPFSSFYYAQPNDTSFKNDTLLYDGLLYNVNPFNTLKPKEYLPAFYIKKVEVTNAEYKPEFDSYFEFRTLVNSEFRVKIAKTGRALSSNFYDENRFSQV
ncbi:MAG: hypothetical protein ACI8ZN_001491 [Bacteroidia bacterium]|jgi:hypothetical protein